MAKAMDSQSRFIEVCEELNISEEVQSCLAARDYKTASDFAFSIPDPESLEIIVKRILRDDESPEGNALNKKDMSDSALKVHIQAGRLRRLYADCKALTTVSEPGPSTAMAVTPPNMNWEGAPPPKLSEESKNAMKTAWRKNYPSEILDDNTQPGPRYWAKVFHMLKDGSPKKYDVWTKIMSKADEENLEARRAGRLPRNEVQSLLNACFEEDVELSEGDISGNPWLVSKVLEKRRNAFSLCGAAHLSSLKGLDNKLLTAYTNTVSPELGLRSPTIAEAREVDRIIWGRIFNLVEDHGWSMEDSIHEIATVRGDIDSLMQPRPKKFQQQSKTKSGPIGSGRYPQKPNSHQGTPKGHQGRQGQGQK